MTKYQMVKLEDVIKRIAAGKMHEWEKANPKPVEEEIPQCQHGSSIDLWRTDYAKNYFNKHPEELAEMYADYLAKLALPNCERYGKPFRPDLHHKIEKAGLKELDRRYEEKTKWEAAIKKSREEFRKKQDAYIERWDAARAALSVVANKLFETMLFDDKLVSTQLEGLKAFKFPKV